MTYRQKLKDPRWQKKRLRIMERDEFQCQQCGSTTNTLNVDHAYYIKYTDPWDYEDGMLTTYCEKCHKLFYHLRREIEKMVGFLSLGGLRTIGSFIWAESAFARELGQKVNINTRLPWSTLGDSAIAGITKATGIKKKDLVKLVESDGTLSASKVSQQTTDNDIERDSMSRLLCYKCS